MAKRKFDLEYVVLTGDVNASEPTTDEALDTWKQYVRWERIARERSPQLFDPPVHAPDPEGTLWRPMSADLAAELASDIAKAEVGWRLVCDVDCDDTDPIYSAMSFASAILSEQEGIAVIDRESRIGYSAEAFEEHANELAFEDSVTIPDMVLAEREERAGGMRVRTRGMRKFGHRDLVHEGVLARHVDFAIWHLIEGLAPYASLGNPLLPGQNMAYTSADRGLRMYVDETADGLLRITDCEREEKRSTGDGRWLLVTLYPTFLVRHRQMTHDEDDTEDDDGAPTPELDTVERYARFTKMLHDGAVDAAFAEFRVTWATLASTTFGWTERLSDPATRKQFAKHLWG